MKKQMMWVLALALALPAAAAERRPNGVRPRTVAPATAARPASAAPAAYRSDAPRRDLFSGHFGLALPMTGDLNDIADAGFVIGGEWIHRIRPDLGFGAGLEYVTYGDHNVGPGHTSVDQITIQALVRKDLAFSGTAQPYLMGGLGLTDTELTVHVDNAFFSGSASDDDTSPSFMFGAGMDFPLQSGINVGFDARYCYYFFDVGNESDGGSLQIRGHVRW